MRTHLLLPILAAALLAIPAAACTQQPAGAPTPLPAAPGRGMTAFQHATVIDVESGRRLQDVTIVVDGARITFVGEGARVKLPGGTRVVDATGKFIIPGLFDMHVHAASPGLDRFFMPALLANGITGVREMFSVSSLVDSTRRQISAGAVPGPRVASAAGHILDGRPAIWPGSVGVADAETGRRAVDSLRRAGADFIKVYSRLSPDAFRAIAAESKRLGIPFAGHIPTLVSASEASDLGQKSVEHLTGVLGGCSRIGDSLRAESAAAVASARGWDSAGIVSRGQAERLLGSYDPARCRELARRFVRNGTWMVPTIAVLRSTAFLSDSTLAADPRLRYIPPFFKNSWNPRSDFRFRMLTDADWAARRRVYERQREIIRLMKEEGVQFLAGTDLANPYIYPGFSLHDELASFVELGFTPLEALQSATILPARYLGASDSLGTVARGKVADLVMLDGDPLADIGQVRRVSGVMADGRWYDADALRGLLTAVEEMVRRL